MASLTSEEAASINSKASSKIFSLIFCVPSSSKDFTYESSRIDNFLFSINAAKLVAADYAGIDLIKDRYGNYKVIEINSVPAWKGLQKTTDKNIASILAKTFVKKLK